MSELSEEGFLSDEMSAVISTSRLKYAPWLQLVREINVFAVKLQYQLSIDSHNLQQVLSAALFCRVLANIQAAILLIERGMDSQARVILRAGLEAIFTLRAISESAETAQKFVDADEVERRRLLKKSRKWSSPELQLQAKAAATDELLLEINAEIERSGAEEINVADMSVKAGLHDWYLTAYSIFSHSVHSNARDLQRHLIVNAAGEVIGMQNEPAVENLDRLLCTSAEVMLVAVAAVSNVFVVTTREFCDRSYDSLKKLAETLGADSNE